MTQEIPDLKVLEEKTSRTYHQRQYHNGRAKHLYYDVLIAAHDDYLRPLRIESQTQSKDTSRERTILFLAVKALVQNIEQYKSMIEPFRKDCSIEPNSHPELTEQSPEVAAMAQKIYDQTKKNLVEYYAKLNGGEPDKAFESSPRGGGEVDGVVQQRHESGKSY